MIPALIVGAWTAWYLGFRTGAVLAVVTFVALIAAMFVPGLRLAVYALVLGWCAALYFFGPKISSSPIGQATAWAKKLWNQDRK